jgi:hypothetical protein
MRTSDTARERHRLAPPDTQTGYSQFSLRFAPADVPRLVECYLLKEDDGAALGAGLRIRGGDFSRDNLTIIFDWKTGGRGRSRLDRNTTDEITDALALAVSAKTERAAVAVLMGLNGVQTPVASAVLTAIDPARYTVIDFRALESLGIKNKTITVDFYLEYLDYCRQLADKFRITLRDMDRALWQWSKEHPAG